MEIKDKRLVAMSEHELLDGDWKEIVKYRCYMKNSDIVCRYFRLDVADGWYLILCKTECVSFSFSTLKFGKIHMRCMLSAYQRISPKSDVIRGLRNSADGRCFSDAFEHRLYDAIESRFPMSESEIASERIGIGRSK